MRTIYCIWYIQMIYHYLYSLLISYHLVSFMQLLAEVQEFYRIHHIKNNQDSRIEEEKVEQGKIIRRINDRNLSVMGITLTPKKLIKYSPSPLKKIELGEGVYCYVTDNGVKSDQTIFAIHGYPGNCGEWAAIETQMKGRYRWVNFAIPGCDGQDERRGTYNGHYPDLVQLIYKLMQFMDIKRPIVCGHSFGSSVAFNVAEKYPNFIEGFINLAGLTNYWSFGMTIVYKAVAAQFKYYEQQWENKKLYNIDEERDKIYARYMQYFQDKKYANFGIPFFKKFEYFSALKLYKSTPAHHDHVFIRYRNLDQIRMLVYGRGDPLQFPEKVESTIHFLLFDEKSYVNKPYFQKLFKLIKAPLEARLKNQFGISVQGDKIQQYFCFYLDNTGHALQRRRPEEISKIIPIYLTTLQVIHQHKSLLQSHL